MNEEKEKMKKLNSNFLANVKFMKGRKKGNYIKKDEENEISPYNINSIKLKEIYRELSSKKLEKSIKNMLLISIIIFILIIATGILGIVIYSYIKNSIYSFYILIQQSEYLYKNLLFEGAITKELLMISNPYYTNILDNNKTLYYKKLSKIIYNYYLDNTFIISNLTNRFNVLSKKDEESLTRTKVEIQIINPVHKTQTQYNVKKYNTFIYSAYREINSVLYHISQFEMEKIHHFQEDAYYFLLNGKTHLLVSSQKQILTLNEKMAEKVKSGHNIIIICCVVIFLVYCFCTFIFSYFYKYIIIKRKNYLSILRGLDKNLIISSIHNCENFIKKLQEKNGNNESKKRKIYSDLSSLNDSEIENFNFGFQIENKKKEIKSSQQKMNEKENKTNLIKNHILQIILFLIFLVWQIGIYIYYFQKLTLYKNFSSYEYYISLFATNFLLPFICLREYPISRKIKFYDTSVSEYINNTLDNFYVIYSQSSEMMDIYRKDFPDSYQDFLNNLYNSKICEYINFYNNEYPDAKTNCETFFFGSAKFGFLTILSNYIEEIRTLKCKIDDYYEISDAKNFHYNESLVNSPDGFYEDLYAQYSSVIDEYTKYNPINIMKTDSHKRLLITYLYINTEFYNAIINESLNKFENLFEKYNSIFLILNIIFIIVVFFGFLFIWIPFIFNINKNFIIIKNMIYIIPSELLINISDINNLLKMQ